MTQLRFGHTNHLIFTTLNEKYETIGFLANSRRTSLRWEHNENSGAWGSEGRIHCNSDLTSFPSPLQNKFTKGVGGVLRRINCNQFVKLLATRYSFQLGDIQNSAAIRATIPSSYLVDYDRGFAI